MKHVLLVDDEKSFLLSLSEGLAPFQSDFTVYLAANGLEAMGVLSQHKIDLVVTDLKMPQMDGFELLAQLVRQYPATPAIVMTAFGTRELEEHIRKIGTFPYLEKPIELHFLAERILNELDAQAKGIIRGFSLPSFLQLVEMEQKTFTLRISSQGRVAYLYFLQGELLDAETSTLRGEEAVFEILQWSEPEIQINHHCRRETRVIQNSLSNVLLDAMRQLDELNWGVSTSPQGEEPPSREFFSFQSDTSTDSSNVSPGGSSKSGLETLYQNGRELPILFSTELDQVAIPLKSEQIVENVAQRLREAMEIDGALAVALCDWRERICLGTDGVDSSVFPLEKLELAIAGNIEVVKAKQLTTQYLAMENELEDMLFTLKNQYHVIRVVRNHPNLFLYLVLSRPKSNLAMARLIFSRIESKLVLE